MPKHCPDCHAAVPDDAPGGFCPGCLFARADGELDKMSAATVVAAHPNPNRDFGFADLPRCVGDYELIEEIARGGMGVVYKARQHSLDRLVAVKMLLGGLSSKEFIQRFRIEASAAANLHHPNIVAVHEVGAHHGDNYLVMDWVDGPNLAELVRRQPLAPRLAATYLKQVAEAIEYAHSRNILHRDLKPANILIDSANRPRITDFGLAKRLDCETDLTLSGQVLGSPNYMAPEQAAAKRGTVNRRSDIYSLGAVLYHLMTGRPPFQGETLAEVLQQVVQTNPVPPRLLKPSVPPDLETICLKCVEKEPGRRYATAQALADELGRFLNHQPILARRVGPAGRLWRWCRRKPAMAGLLLLLHIVFVVGLSGIAWQWRRATQGQLAARQNLYAAHMLLAQQALEQGDLRRLMELLQEHQPQQGEQDLRGWEWRYLRQFLQGDELCTLSRDADSVESVTFSPDGRLLATGGAQGIKLWDVAVRRQLADFRQGTERCTCAAFSPAGRWLASAEAGGAVRVWDTQALPPALPFTLQENSGGRLAWSADGEWLANVVWGDSVTRGESRFRVWDVNARREVAHADIETEIGLAPSPNYEVGRTQVRGPLSVAFSPKEALLAIGTQHGTIVLWDATARAALCSFPADAAFVRTVAFSPDGRWLASGGREHNVRIWSVPDAQLVTNLVGHTGELNCIAFSPGGQKLATASRDQTVKLWETSMWRLLATLRGHVADVQSVAFAPDGQMLASGSRDGTVRLWSANPRPSRNPVEFPLVDVLYCCLAADGSALMTLNQDSTCRVLRPVTGQQIARFPVPAPDTTHGAVANGGGQVALGTQDGKISVWDTASGRSVQTFKAHGSAVQAIAISADRKLLATAGRDDHPETHIRVWRIATGNRLAELGQAHPLVLRLGFSPDGGRIAATFNDGTAAVWQPLTGALVGRFSGHRGVVFAGSLTDTRLATAGGDAQARVWDLRSGRVVATLRSAVWEFLSCALSPDQMRLAAAGGDGTVRLWDLRTQQEVAHLGRERSYAHDLAWTPDGNTLISVSQEKLIVWRTPPLDEIDHSTTRQAKAPD